MDPSRNFVESLARGLSILTALTNRARPLSLTELSKELGLSVSTIQRLTYTLQRLGYLQRNQENKKFWLTPKILSLGLHYLSDSDLTQVAYPYLQELSQETNETINLIILDEEEVVYIQRIPTPQLLHSGVRLGSRFPAYCTSGGKAILAFLPESRIEAILKKMDFKSFTPYTITNRQTLLQELNEIKIRGFASCNEEIIIGIKGVAAPIRNYEGEVVAAVHISIPSVRIKSNEWEAIWGGKVMIAAAKISSAMGYHE